MTYKRTNTVAVAATGISLLALAAITLFVQATWGDAPPPPPVRVEDAPEAVRPHLRLVGSIPVLRLSGTPREMGFQHGAALRPQIRFLYREYYEAMVKRVVGESELRAWAKDVEPFIPGEYVEEMRGLAEGSCLPYEEILLVNTMVDRFQTIACSTVVAAGDATKDGTVYFGRNLDFPGRNILQRMTVVIVWSPEGGAQLAAVTWPGMIGVLSGMNAEGVSGATMLVHKGRPRRPGIPYLMMYRQALAAAHKKDDVYAEISKAKRTSCNNFMVVDATGASEVIEFDPEVIVRRPATNGCVCSTNFFASDDLRDRCVPWGKGRYQSLADFLDREHGRIDLDLVKKALADVATPFYLNVQAMVFLPGKLEIHVAEGGELPAAKRPYVRLSRDVLFGE
ncbi:MAG TPA: C45 family peptidase [Planctomycetota bacterium]|nr:C45 family peptidase [Planctomycetota bacterium]